LPFGCPPPIRTRRTRSYLVLTQPPLFWDLRHSAPFLERFTLVYELMVPSLSALSVEQNSSTPPSLFFFWVISSTCVSTSRNTFSLCYFLPEKRPFRSYLFLQGFPSVGPGPFFSAPRFFFFFSPTKGMSPLPLFLSVYPPPPPPLNRLSSSWRPLVSFLVQPFSLCYRDVTTSLKIHLLAITFPRVHQVTSPQIKR